ncbi:hypothetical protein Glove_232g88 [Diversispora epigaea]|uniref:Uncharacterized protein n=1 Tax=Diversispora epigaea TaxID=1348612 RepID=A0A397IIZ6_9GLOM|nr:hypothetical protein Glove_232g88 [Diversispora epigaea]
MPIFIKFIRKFCNPVVLILKRNSTKLWKIFIGKIGKFGHLDYLNWLNISKLIYQQLGFLVKLKFSQIYRTSYQVKNFEGFCNSIISKHPNTFFGSKNILSLPEYALISTLKDKKKFLED